MRKTIEIVKLKEYVNKQLKGLSSVETRLTLIILLENMLHEAKAYKGFTYLEARDVPDNCEPGMILDMETRQALAFPDETRRVYL